MLMYRTILFALSTFLAHALSFSDPLILLTGGTGYIGSHVAVELMQNGYDVLIVDNLSNSNDSVIEGIEKIAGRKITAFYKADLTDKPAIESIFDAHHIEAVIHFSGFKALKESIGKPILYYQNNLISTLVLLEVMKSHNCHRLVFSSSATVYGSPKYLPIDEKHPTAPTNPYGYTKLMIEQFLEDTSIANEESEFLSLRYFNPVGAHESGLIGERPNGIPQNLVPYMLDVVSGKQPYLRIFGDGTAIRDYIHIMDLAFGHVLALRFLFSGNACGHGVYNLGTGKGYSVSEMVAALSKAWGKHLPFEYAEPRPGDVPVVYADTAKAKAAFGFVANRTLEHMMTDSLRWLAHLLSRK